MMNSSIGTSPQPEREPRRRASLQMYCAIALCVFGMLLITAGFWVAPTGLIHGSVLVAYGEVMTFAGALFGIDYHARR